MCAELILFTIEISIKFVPIFVLQNILRNIKVQRPQRICQAWENGIASSAQNGMNRRIACYRISRANHTREGRFCDHGKKFGWQHINLIL